MIIRLQSPIQLNDHSEPEPDVAMVQPDPLDYEAHHPTPLEAYLLIEVADSSFKFDCETKARLYARSGIADYWVLDVKDRQLHVFRSPNQDRMAIKTMTRSAKLSVWHFCYFPTSRCQSQKCLAGRADQRSRQYFFND